MYRDPEAKKRLFEACNQFDRHGCPISKYSKRLTISRNLIKVSRAARDGQNRVLTPSQEYTVYQFPKAMINLPRYVVQKTPPFVKVAI